VVEYSLCLVLLFAWDVTSNYYRNYVSTMEVKIPVRMTKHSFYEEPEGVFD
jgi:hypothetical protein